MKVSHRNVLKAAGLAAALAVSATPSVVGAQTRQGPGPDTKKVLVTAFRGDAEGGVKLADELRNRISSDFNIRQLMPVPKKDIDVTLVNSGYRPDSALNPNDIRELSKLVRGDEIIDGTVTKTASGYRVSARMFLPRDVSLSQPLLNAEGSNLGDMAKQIVREYDAARKQLPANRDCDAALNEKKIDAAIAAARKGIAAYPKATIARLCLASAFQSWKTTADSSTKPWKDSVLAVTLATTALDKSSKIAYQLQYDVYKAKSDTANQMQALLGMMNAEPTNTVLREQVINELVITGRASAAVPVVKQLVAENPGDPQYLRTYWLVLRAAQNYKEAIQAGMAYVAADPTAADSGYFMRQIADLGADSSFAKAAEMAASAAAKFPRNASLLVLKGQNERRAGQLPAAKASLERALQIDPKVEGAALQLAQISADMGSVDDAVRAVKADASANPANKDRNAQFLLGLGSTAFRAATASKKEDDFRRALTLFTASDELNPTPNAKFFIGYSAFQLFGPAAQALPRSRSCNDARQVAQYLTQVNGNISAGASYNEAAAKQISDAASGAQPFVDAQVKRLCK